MKHAKISEKQLRNVDREMKKKAKADAAYESLEWGIDRPTDDQLDRLLEECATHGTGYRELIRELHRARERENSPRTPRRWVFGWRECGCKVTRLGVYLCVDRCRPHDAAPELLEALMAFLRWYEGGLRGLSINEGVKLVARAQAAIAKAEGKS